MGVARRSRWRRDTIAVVGANLAPNDSNIVALFATGTDNSESLNWVFLTGNQSTRSGTLTGVTTSFVLPAMGMFEVRALHWVPGIGYVTDVTSAKADGAVDLLPGLFDCSTVTICVWDTPT